MRFLPEQHTRIAILITSYNYGRFIERCIESALQQTASRNSYEIVVVDDGSTDDSLLRLSRFGHAINLIQSPHKGLPAACNTGLDAVSSGHFLRLDADDELEPDAVAAFLTAVAIRPEAIICSDLIQIYADGVASHRRIDPANIYSLESIGVLFPKQVVREVGGYRPLYWEEHDLMIRLRQRLELISLPGAVYRYYKHEASMTTNASARQRGWSQFLDVWGVDEPFKWGHHEEMQEVARRKTQL